MKNKLFIFVIVVIGFLGLYQTSNAFDVRNNNEKSSSIISASKDVRYIMIRGKRYKVWYTVKYRKGRRYILIQRVKRA